MFKKPEIKVPILGIVENMSWFTPAQHLDEKYYIFGKDGGKTISEELNIRLLAQVPLIGTICETADKGLPSSVAGDEIYENVFESLTDNLIEMVKIRNSVLKPTEAVKVDPNAEGCGH